MSEILKIKAIQTDSNYYIADDINSYYDSKLKKYFFDGVKAEESFDKSWMIIKSIPKKVTFLQDAKQINHRFVLKDSSLVSDKIPLELPYSVQYYNEVLESVEFKSPYNNFQSLYELKTDNEGAKEVEVEVEFDILYKVSDLNTNHKFSYNVEKVNWRDTQTVVTNNDVQHQEFDKMFFPKVLLHKTKSKLSSHNTYKIVREYIKNNIDPKVAEIKSDYDFCFSVNKKIPLTKPYEYQVDVSKFRAKRPKYETRLQSHNSYQIFEMTHKESNYKGYTPIQEFEADSEEELKELIDNYCNTLIDIINEPVKECPHCQGVGYIFNKVKE